MLADCADAISGRILSSISKGKGFVLAFETSFQDDRYSGILQQNLQYLVIDKSAVPLLRPMKDLLQEEIVMYLKFSQSFKSDVLAKHNTTIASIVPSIDNLTESSV